MEANREKYNPPPDCSVPPIHPHGKAGAARRDGDASAHGDNDSFAFARDYGDSSANSDPCGYGDSSTQSNASAYSNSSTHSNDDGAKAHNSAHTQAHTHAPTGGAAAAEPDPVPDRDLE